VATMTNLVRRDKAKKMAVEDGAAHVRVAGDEAGRRPAQRVSGSARLGHRIFYFGLALLP
jgi:hypothetical protein